MKYKYKNLKHVTLHGIEPYGEKIFNHPILGGGIELLEKIEDDNKPSSKTIKNNKKNNKEMI